MAHAKEFNEAVPEEPMFFMKPDTALLRNNDPFYIPEWSNDVHHEIELVVKINKIGKNIEKRFAHRYYDEIGLGIDFTARDIQDKCKEKGLPWEKAKGFDGSAVISEFIPKENLGDLTNLEFSLQKNNEIVQQGNTNAMLWKIDELIAYISQFFTLKRGDVIFTGTPAGVGKVDENDILLGMIKDQEMFSIKIK